MNYKSLIEGLLFIAGKDGVSFEKIKKLIKLSDDDINAILEEMIFDYEKNPNRGILIKKFGDSFKFLTKPDINKEITKSFNIKLKNPLNQQLIEVLAIIAYNEPCTRTTILEIKKQDPTPFINQLIDLNLVEEAGRSESVGKPYLYQVTKNFYDIFGINSIKELPEIVLPNDEEISDNSDIDFFDSNRDE